MKEFIIFDTEYTTWEGCNEKGWHGWQKREIVQISAIRVRYDTLEVVDTLNLYIKPKINPILSDYFINLTGISNEEVAQKGISFEAMHEKFVDFVATDVCFSYSWGNPFSELADGEVMNENISLNGLEIEKSVLRYENIAPWFKRKYEENKIEIKGTNSGAIAKNLGVDRNIKRLNLNEHNAIYDCYSILEGLKFLGFNRL